MGRSGTVKGTGRDGAVGDAGEGAVPLEPADVGALFAEHYLRLVRLAAQLVDDAETAEDVVQSVFAALQASGRRPEDCQRYLHTAVLNGARSTLRRRRVARAWRPDRPAVAEAADATSLAAAERARVLAAVRRLPARQREVVVLRYYEHLDVAEIAEVLGIRAGAVSSSLTKALRALAPLVEEP